MAAAASRHMSPKMHSEKGPERGREAVKAQKGFRLSDSRLSESRQPARIPIAISARGNTQRRRDENRPTFESPHRPASNTRCPGEAKYRFWRSRGSLTRPKRRHRIAATDERFGPKASTGRQALRNRKPSLPKCIRTRTVFRKSDCGSRVFRLRSLSRRSPAGGTDGRI